jgi:hypothetical protein
MSTGWTISRMSSRLFAINDGVLHSRTRTSGEPSAAHVS